MNKRQKTSYLDIIAVANISPKENIKTDKKKWKSRENESVTEWWEKELCKKFLIEKSCKKIVIIHGDFAYNVWDYFMPKQIHIPIKSKMHQAYIIKRNTYFKHKPTKNRTIEVYLRSKLEIKEKCKFSTVIWRWNISLFSIEISHSDEFKFYWRQRLESANDYEQLNKILWKCKNNINSRFIYIAILTVRSNFILFYFSY